MLIGLTHQHRFWFLKWYRNGDVHRFSAVFFHRFTCSCVYGVSSHVLIGYVENGLLFILCFLWSQLCHEPTFVFMNYRQFCCLALLPMFLKLFTCKNIVNFVFFSFLCWLITNSCFDHMAPFKLRLCFWLGREKNVIQFKEFAFRSVISKLWQFSFHFVDLFFLESISLFFVIGSSSPLISRSNESKAKWWTALMWCARATVLKENANE